MHWAIRAITRLARLGLGPSLCSEQGTTILTGISTETSQILDAPARCRRTVVVGPGHETGDGFSKGRVAMVQVVLLSGSVGGLIHNLVLSNPLRSVSLISVLLNIVLSSAGTTERIVWRCPRL